MKRNSKNMDCSFLIFCILLVSICLFILWFVLKKERQNFEDKQKPLLFIHIPKTGGTFVEDEFKKYNYKVGRHDPNKNLRTNSTCSFWHTPLKNNKNINFKDYITFTVVRDPYDRIISEYNWKHFPRYKGTGLTRDTEINDFVSELNKDQIIYKGDCHLVPQTEYLTDAYGNKVQHILHQEHLNEELNEFIKTYKLNIQLSTQKRNKQSRNHTKDELNDTSLKLIQKYFKKDFDELKYKM